VNPDLIFAIGTALTWFGWFFALASVWKLVAVFNAIEFERPEAIRSLAISAALAGALLLVGGGMLPPLKEAGLWRLPLYWPVMPVSAWLIILGVIMLASRLFAAWMAADRDERGLKLRQCAGWVVLIVASITWYATDETSKITSLTGGIRFTPSVAVGLLLFLVVAVAAMALASRATASRGVSRNVVTQIALISGSIIFAVPFVYALSTSLKEDRDMSSPNGIVWIPKVQVTVPFLDKENPLYETAYRGQTVQGSVIQQGADGTVTVDIFKPLSVRGLTFITQREKLKEIPKDAPVFSGKWSDGQAIKGFVVEDLEDGRKRLRVTEPESLKDKEATFEPAQLEPVRVDGARWQNYGDALSYMPPETNGGLVYLKNTLILVILGVVGTIVSSSLVAYAFSRMQFPGRNALFSVLLATMMLPGAVTLLPQFLIFRSLGWIDTLYPLWVPAFFGSAFNIFLLRQFFMGIPMELEDASKIDGCTYLRSFWSVMLPQIKPALAVIAIWTFMGAWNNFMGPLIYINSPENMPLSYALQLFQGDRTGEPGLLMAFCVMTMLPVLGVFFFLQKYFIEGVTLSGLGGR
jgi:multiple sugar transport system permease protein